MLYTDPDYKVYKKSVKNLAYMDFAQIFCLHFNEGSVLNTKNRYRGQTNRAYRSISADRDMTASRYAPKLI